MLGRYSEATRSLAELPLDETDDATRQAVAVQQIRLTLVKGDLKTAEKLLTVVSEIKNRTAELDLVLVELMMKLASSDHPDDWRAQASNQLVAIENRHGAYWGRRAELLVIGDSAIDPGGTVANPNAGSAAELDLLMRMGDQAVRKNRLDAAFKAYDNAAVKAAAQQNWQLLFSATVRLSQVLETQLRYREAYQRLIEVSKKLADLEYAPAAHLRGCWNLFQAIEANPESADQIRKEFLDSLDEHVERWPNSETANQARLWAGRQLQTQQQWQPAVQRYTEIATNSPFFADAVKQSYACVQEMLKTAADAQTQARNFADTLKQLTTKPGITARGRTELMLARAKLAFQFEVEDSATLANEIVQSRESADVDDRLLLASQLVAALADSNPEVDLPAVGDVLKTIENNDVALEQAVAGINALIERHQEPASERLLNTKLQIAEKAMTLDLSDAQEINWMGHWADALQRLGRDEEAVAALTRVGSQETKFRGNPTAALPGTNQS